MPRRKVTVPTVVYWLVDKSSGRPFYCGKTVKPPATRLTEHKRAARLHPQRRIASVLNALGDSVEIVTMARVPPGDDWAAVERRWIAQLRLINADAVNSTDGGEGTAGYIHRTESREKTAAALRGVKHTTERNAKRSAILKGRKQGAEHTAKKIGRRASEETRAKMRASHAHKVGKPGRKHTEADKQKMRESFAKRRAQQL